MSCTTPPPFTPPRVEPTQAMPSLTVLSFSSMTSSKRGDFPINEHDCFQFIDVLPCSAAKAKLNTAVRVGPELRLGEEQRERERRAEPEGPWRPLGGGERCRVEMTITTATTMPAVALSPGPFPHFSPVAAILASQGSGISRAGGRTVAVLLSPAACCP